MSKLYIIPTPIGNLKDITLRAVECLKSSDLIISENTLHSRSLLTHYDINAILTSYNDSSDAKNRFFLLEKIKQNKHTCLISDAGTPLISDPGYKLVKLCIENGVEIEALPGPCAAITGLVESGLPTMNFLFLGFLPESKEKRKNSIMRLKNFLGITIVLYESSRRILNLLSDLELYLGSEIIISVSKEMTKIHHKTYRSTIKNVLQEMRLNDKSVKGEFIVCLNIDEKEEISISDLVEKYKILKSASTKDLAKFIAQEESISKSKAYQACLEIKG